MASLEKGLEESLALPESHRRGGRTTNGLERLIDKGRRRTKAMGPMTRLPAGPISQLDHLLPDCWTPSA